MTASPVARASQDVRLSFKGVTAIDGVSFEVHPDELFAIIGPNGAGKTSLFNVLSGRLPPAGGIGASSSARASSAARPYEIASRGMARTFQNIALFEHLTVIDNLMLGRHQHIKYGPVASILWRGPGPPRGDRAPRLRRGDRRLPRAAPVAFDAGRPVAVRRPEACGAGAGARHGAQAAAARRTGRRDEPRGDRGHRTVHPRHPRRAARADHHGRARHGPGHGPRRPGDGRRLRHPHHHRHAGRGADAPRRHPGLPRAKRCRSDAAPPPASATTRPPGPTPSPCATSTSAIWREWTWAAYWDHIELVGQRPAGARRRDRRPGRDPLGEPPRVAGRRHGRARRARRVGRHLPDQPDRRGALRARRLRGAR